MDHDKLIFSLVPTLHFKPVVVEEPPPNDRTLKAAVKPVQNHALDRTRIANHPQRTTRLGVELEGRVGGCRRSGTRRG